jgi:ABC-type bacteriocin/lantibiotic exporter with double-glycine peptidase domain
MSTTDKLQPKILVDHVDRIFHSDGREVAALRDVSMSITRGRFVVLMGPSGSGKTTLLNLIGGLDQPTTGRLMVDDQALEELNANELTALRRRLYFPEFCTHTYSNCLRKYRIGTTYHGWRATPGMG